MKQKEFKGKFRSILWDVENLDVDGKKYFTYKEALEIAEKLGKRLPDMWDMEELIEHGYEWSDKRKGAIIGGLFFPASGFYYSGKNGGISHMDLQGAIWLNGKEPEHYPYKTYLRFHIRGNSPTFEEHGRDEQSKLPVRLVQDRWGKNKII